MSSRPASKPEPSPESAAAAAPVINEVRYSLPDLLAELQLERTTGAFSQEKLHQVEIGKLFQNRKKRRGKTSS
ncbi:hypothetical protein [Rariglobus hedericola]|uniref:Uncharacterized protein n=1 Tax=Rariglobus hedericola TaxID=2597822 RepID=A0A556QP05_9BACT|nr:hypothetical protein [Rariglobus hedericola]TSJ78359.1 hypothetical protein FPL22_03375 [Rariglobus hedericola]